MAIQTPASLRLDKSRLGIKVPGRDEQFVPIEDLHVLLLDFAATHLSLPLLSALAEAEVAVVICGPKHLPVASLLPFAAHHRHALFARKQAEVSEPRKKQIWRQVVQAKVGNQAEVLKTFGRVPRGFAALPDRVLSGDTGNVEAQAAARYFPALFGEDFERNPDADGINAMLNYGYALMRAATARAICAAGLHPAFGIHHHSQFDPYALADDLMEPLRPAVDAHIKRFLNSEGLPDPVPIGHPDDDLGQTVLSPDVKRMLLEVLTLTCTLDGKRWPLGPALEVYCANLRRALFGEIRRLPCPGGFVWEV